jgi:hypothetical protein
MVVVYGLIITGVVTLGLLIYMYAYLPRRH